MIFSFPFTEGIARFALTVFSKSTTSRKRLYSMTILAAGAFTGSEDDILISLFTCNDFFRDYRNVISSDEAIV
jgi:hypothetical protein